VRRQRQMCIRDRVNLSARFRARGFSAQQFRLAMSRNEIGNYLGLAVETVSRVFTRFQQNGLISAEGKEVHILDSIELCALAGGQLEG
ncbi:transcriptional regulator, partial [Pseudomonas aeruginosa]|nr:transcriptional regulator [Pseudomonas aeruginosa]